MHVYKLGMPLRSPSGEILLYPGSSPFQLSYHYAFRFNATGGSSRNPNTVTEKTDSHSKFLLLNLRFKKLSPEQAILHNTACQNVVWEPVHMIFC